MRIVVEAPFASGKIRPVRAFSVLRLCGHREIATGRETTQKRLWSLLRTPCDECLPEWLDDEAKAAEMAAED